MAPRDTDGHPYAVNYPALVVPLLAAARSERAARLASDATIATLQDLVSDLLRRVSALESPADQRTS